ncbi:hypothetical protein RRG08_015808 [Elysia crispata]|uniref:Uncharacterized protein n=1 Tax=Elysia crispata TaxID=231223 RepID=A0AAE1A1W0_9GAST|nr:hypothetical protein RRG08_015808 [Elysia crispata]
MSIGDGCFVQNQTGISPKQWDRTGIVVDVGANDQYIVKINGSGRLTSRNRRFLRQFQPASVVISFHHQRRKLQSDKSAHGKLTEHMLRQTLPMHQLRSKLESLSHPLNPKH